MSVSDRPEFSLIVGYASDMGAAEYVAMQLADACKDRGIDVTETELNDIPLADLTRQYLAYVEQIRKSNLELASEYLLMAAMLIEIKSRMLLPRPPRDDGEEVLDPRAELHLMASVRQLEECQRRGLLGQLQQALLLQAPAAAAVQDLRRGPSSLVGGHRAWRQVGAMPICAAAQLSGWRGSSMPVNAVHRQPTGWAATAPVATSLTTGAAAHGAGAATSAGNGSQGGAPNMSSMSGLPMVCM